MLVAVLTGALAVPAGALGADADKAPPKRPWATINVCDTAGEPNVVGIRAGMPGNGTRQRMYMRFEPQWYRASAGRYVSTGTRSPWVRAGSARFAAAQRGFDFDFDDPPAGKRFKLRGLVRFEWRKRREVEGSERVREVVVRRARRITRGGLDGVERGKPPGRSDAVCVIDSPAD